MVWNHLLDRFRISFRYDHFRFGIKMYTHTDTLVHTFDFFIRFYLSDDFSSLSPLSVRFLFSLHTDCSLAFFRLFRVQIVSFFLNFFSLYHNRTPFNLIRQNNQWKLLVLFFCRSWNLTLFCSDFFIMTIIMAAFVYIMHISSFRFSFSACVVFLFDFASLCHMKTSWTIFFWDFSCVRVDVAAQFQLCVWDVHVEIGSVLQIVLSIICSQYCKMCM